MMIMGDGVWISDLDNNLFLPVFFLVLVSIEKIHQTLRTMFNDIFKHLEVCQNTPLRAVFSTLFSEFENVVNVVFRV